MTRLSFDDLPYRVVNDMIVPLIPIRSLVTLAGTCRHLNYIITRHTLWREAMLDLFPERYRELYQDLHGSIPFFHLTVVEIRLSDVEKQRPALEWYRERCYESTLVSVDVICWFTILVPAYCGIKYAGKAAYTGLKAMHAVNPAVTSSIAKLVTSTLCLGISAAISDSET